MKASHRQQITSHAIILLIGVFLCSVYFMWSDTRYIGGPIELSDTYEFSLSEASPVFQYNIYHSRIGISSIETNDTYVSVIARDSDNVIFNCTNITVLSEFSIEIPQAGLSSDWWLEVRRQNQDAQVNLVVYHMAQAVVMIDAIVLPGWALFAGIVLSCFAIYKLVNIRCGYKTQRKLVTIIVLMILGPLCSYPFLFGYTRDDFRLDEYYTLTLNTTHPNSTIDISALYPEEESGVSFRIHSIASTEYPIQLSVIKNETYRMVLEQETAECDWSILIPANINTSITLGVDGLGADLGFTISVETIYRIIIVNQDITVPAVLGILGAAAIIIGLVEAIRLESDYSS